MNYHISDRMASMRPSMVREILKATSDPSVIPFAAGNPAPNAFPVAEVQRIVGEILAERPIDALQYSITEGYPPLREALRQLCASHYGIPMREQDDLIVLSGAQQGMDLATKVLCNEGDTVLCEDPSFIGSLNCFRSYHVNLVGVPMEEDGISLPALEEALQREKNVRMLYLIPNFQNPTGITTSLEKRRELYRICAEAGVMILEDNPYGDLRFSGEAIPSLKSMDTEGIVIYVGSFSKILAPGVRVGWTIAPKPLIAKMTVGKQCADVHTTILTQMLCERWLATCDLQAHLARLQEIYRQKCALMLDCIDREFSPKVTHTVPQGGLFLWCTLPKGSDMLAFCKAAVDRGVAMVPGSAFLTDDHGTSESVRLNFSTPTDEQIVDGISRLGDLTKKMF